MSTPGDQARVSVALKVPPAAAFRIFVEDIDQWWLHGLKFRASGRAHGVLYLEPRVGGALYEVVGERTVPLGTVIAYDPPARLVFEWRGVTLKGADRTEVEVEFAPTATGTLVTLTHRGWSRIPSDHPVRHGEEASLFLRRMGLWWGELLSSWRERTSEQG
jgi:uncharacterized protein YndB with AHSA1/START domain